MMEFGTTNISHSNLITQTAANRQERVHFAAQKEEEQGFKKPKKRSLKEISDIVILSSSAVLIGLPLLASLKKNKKQGIINQVGNLKTSTQRIKEELIEEGQNSKKAPFIQKFGEFWDKMAKNHKELTNNVIYALGVIVIEPLVILFSPFGHKKSSKQDKINAIARLPITMLSTLSFQYSLDKFIGDLIPKLSRKGFLGDKFKSNLPDFSDLPKIHQTKLNAMKEATIFTLGLMSLPLGICLTNTLFGKYMKYAKNKQDKKQNQEQKSKQVSFKGAYEKKLTFRINQWISKPIKTILEKESYEKKIKKLGEEGVKSELFQKLLMWGVVAKDTVRAIGNIGLTYYNNDIPNDERVYLTYYHVGIAIPNIIVDIVAGFGAIKYQDKILESALKKLKLSASAHMKTKNGLKFFIPFAVATILGKRIIAPAISVPIAGEMKKKMLDKQKRQNKTTQE